MVKRILHIVGGMDRAGAETMIMNLYRNVDREKIQFDFLYFKSKKCDYDEEIIALGGKIHRLIFKNPLDQYKKLIHFYKKHTEYKIVHSHTLLNSAITLSAAKKVGIPYRIAHSHNTSNGKNGLFKKIYEKWAIKKISKVGNVFFSCGKEASNYLFPNKESKFILNGIDVDEYHRISQENRNYLEKLFEIKNQIKLIQIGRLDAVKNHQFSLQLAELLMIDNYDFKLFIVGQGPSKKYIEKIIKQKKLSNHVVLLGVRNDVPQLMAGADLMLMPSLHEGFPVVLVESQAIGLPALISTEISKEVDLNLNLVYFCSLDDNLEVWQENIHSIVENGKNNTDSFQLLKQKGFDAVTNALELENFYLNL